MLIRRQNYLSQEHLSSVFLLASDESAAIREAAGNFMATLTFPVIRKSLEKEDEGIQNFF